MYPQHESGRARGHNQAHHTERTCPTWPLAYGAWAYPEMIRSSADHAMLPVLKKCEAILCLNATRSLQQQQQVRELRQQQNLTSNNHHLAKNDLGFF